MDMHYLDNRIIEWFNRRGITTQTIKDFNISWDSNGIYIPVTDNDNNFLYKKVRRLPEDHDSIKYRLPKGSSAQLFGSQFLNEAETSFLVEGELDAMVMYSHNCVAVSSTNGCKTFREEWAELLKGKTLYVCYDNDQAGQEGMAKLYKLFPNAYYIFLPKEAGVKDISDYHERGGDIHELKNIAIQFKDIDAIEQDMRKRKVMWQNTDFHRAILKEHMHEQETYAHKALPPAHQADFDNDKDRAKAVPLTEFIDFRPHRKAICLWHKETTPSMTYYPQSNTFYCFGCGKSGDVISVVMEQQGISFIEAVTYLNEKY